MNDKLYNLIADPNVCFYLKSTELLSKMLVADDNPLLKKLNAETKADLISGKVILIDRQDVYKMLMGGLGESEQLLLKTGEIRVVGSPNLKLQKDQIKEI